MPDFVTLKKDGSPVRFAQALAHLRGAAPVWRKHAGRRWRDVG
jgi:hypothetical protein